MSKATAVLFGIEDEFDVLSVGRLAPGQVKIVIESVSRPITGGMVSADIRPADQDAIA